MRNWLVVMLLALLAGCGSSDTPASPVFTVVGPPTLLVRPQPGNRYGFEGGEILRSAGSYYWFTTELTGAPFWAKTTLAVWASRDGTRWHRVGNLFPTSSADESGDDRRAALWAPMPVYDTHDDRWRLFYVSYRSTPKSINYDGEIWEARSIRRGPAGIVGPYVDLRVVLSEETRGRQPWEGHQGDDSFYPYQLPDGSWRAFYGSSTRKVWRIGVVSAPSLDGPWKRLAKNPLALSKTIENPVARRILGRYIAVYDDVQQTSRVGCMWSTDGSSWQICGEIPTSGHVRTPLGLDPRPGRGGLTLFYTACPSTCDLYSERISDR